MSPRHCETIIYCLEVSQILFIIQNQNIFIHYPKCLSIIQKVYLLSKKVYPLFKIYPIFIQCFIHYPKTITHYSIFFIHYPTIYPTFIHYSKYFIQYAKLSKIVIHYPKYLSIIQNLLFIIQNYYSVLSIYPKVIQKSYPLSKII